MIFEFVFSGSAHIQADIPTWDPKQEGFTAVIYAVSSLSPRDNLRGSFKLRFHFGAFQ